MKRDDFFRNVAVILSYLYARMQDKPVKMTPEAFIQPLSKHLPISEGYLNRILRSLSEDGYVSGVSVVKITGSYDARIFNISDIEITSKGIEHLHFNPGIRKALEWMRKNEEQFPGMCSSMVSVLNG